MKKSLKNLFAYYFPIALLGAIIAFTICFVSTRLYAGIDTEPATEQDYLALEEMAGCLEGNSNLSSDFGNANAENGTAVLVTFENEECKVNVSYAWDMSIISIDRQDKARDRVMTIVSVGFIAIIAAAGIALIAVEVWHKIILLMPKFVDKQKRKKTKNTTATTQGG